MKVCYRWYFKLPTRYYMRQGYVFNWFNGWERWASTVISEMPPGIKRTRKIDRLLKKARRSKA